MCIGVPCITNKKENRVKDLVGSTSALLNNLKKTHTRLNIFCHKLLSFKTSARINSMLQSWMKVWIYMKKTFVSRCQQVFSLTVGKSGLNIRNLTSQNSSPNLLPMFMILVKPELKVIT